MIYALAKLATAEGIELRIRSGKVRNLLNIFASSKLPWRYVAETDPR